MKVLAIIPARGGSKGIPHKNLKPLNGTPLVVHTIHAAQGAELVDKIAVTSDAEDILALATNNGAYAVKRPAELSTDTASSEAALLHCIETLETQCNYCSDIVVFLQCTSPFTTPSDIDATIRTLLNERADCAFTASLFHRFIWTRGRNGLFVGVNHSADEPRKRRQELNPQFKESGSVYAMRTNGFKKSKSRFFGKTVIYEIPENRTLEIDEPSDFELAEFYTRQTIKAAQEPKLPSQIDAIVFDFDGVLTDNKVYLTDSGSESVACSRSDGMGIDFLRKAGYPMLILSTETNSVVSARAKKLKLQCIQASTNKLASLQQWLIENSFSIKKTVYLGNDVNDLDCILAAGCSITPSDAHATVKKHANIVLKHRGGNGAVRELAELILETRR